MLSPTEVLAAILAKPTDLEHVGAPCTDDVTYVSLNYDNPDLKKVMSWAGSGHGSAGIAQTFVDVGRCWETPVFDIEALFGSGENVSAFGRFTHRSVVLGNP